MKKLRKLRKGEKPPVVSVDDIYRQVQNSEKLQAGMVYAFTDTKVDRTIAAIPIVGNKLLIIYDDCKTLRVVHYNKKRYTSPEEVDDHVAYLKEHAEWINKFVGIGIDAEWEKKCSSKSSSGPAPAP